MIGAAAWAGAEPPAPPEQPVSASSDVGARVKADEPVYRLAPGDTVRVTVFGEPDLATERPLDDGGRLRLPLVGELPLAGKTDREAEAEVARAYREGRFLRAPEVSVTITAWRPREVYVLGQFNRPGKIVLPPGRESIDLLELVTLAGGFTPTARGSAVRITRRGPDGAEVRLVVDAERFLSGRALPEPGDPAQRILPGDTVFVPQRIL